MRRPSAVLFAVLGTLYFSSYSTGPARNDVDGTSSGLAGSRECSGCHNGGNFGTKTAFALVDAQGRAQTAYRSGETYKLRVTIATATAPAGYGFQLLLIDGQKAQAGTFGLAPQNTQVSEFNGRSYFEHSRRLSAASVEVDWTAPARGTGALSVYAVGNAVNGNGGTGGDEPDEAIVTLAESQASATREEAWPAHITIAQSAGTITIRDGGGFGESPYAVRLYDMSGRLSYSGVLAKAGLEITGLQAGTHVVRLEGESGAGAGRILVLLP